MEAVFICYWAGCLRKEYGSSWFSPHDASPPGLEGDGKNPRAKSEVFNISWRT